MSSKLKRHITKKFSRLGYSLKKDSLLKLLELSDEYDSDKAFDKILDEIGDLITEQNLTSPIINVNDLNTIINKIHGL